MKCNNRQDFPKIIENADGIIFNVYVQPRASRNELCGFCGDELKLRLTSPPVEGSANKMCIQYLAELLGISKSRVTIVRGEKSRHKTVRAINVKKEDFIALLQRYTEF
jgi:uncharacterized protein (TIGR00251 family)